MAQHEQNPEEVRRIIQEKLGWLDRIRTFSDSQEDWEERGGRVAIPDEVQPYATAMQEIFPLECSWNDLLDTEDRTRRYYVRRMQTDRTNFSEQHAYVEFKQKVKGERRVHWLEWGWSKPFDDAIARAQLQHMPISLRV